MARTPPAPNSAACGVFSTFFNFWGNVSCQVRKSCEWDLKESRILSYVTGFRKASNFAVKLCFVISMSGAGVGAQDTSV